MPPFSIRTVPDAFYKMMDSPVGTLALIASDQGLHGVNWSQEADIQAQGYRDSDSHPILLATEQQLSEYFAGERKSFDVPLEPQGTPFQLQIWKLMLNIPYGKTLSYGELAAQAGDVKASRAVGMANNRNPIAIIIPCHRVIGSSGALTGFGGGLANKSFLLDLESQLRLF